MNRLVTPYTFIHNNVCTTDTVLCSDSEQKHNFKAVQTVWQLLNYSLNL